MLITLPTGERHGSCGLLLAEGMHLMLNRTRLPHALSFILNMKPIYRHLELNIIRTKQLQRPLVAYCLILEMERLDFLELSWVLEVYHFTSTIRAYLIEEGLWVIKTSVNR